MRARARNQVQDRTCVLAQFYEWPRKRKPSARPSEESGERQQGVATWVDTLKSAPAEFGVA